MSKYLTRDEIAELVGCQARSLGCMRRWLARNKWPFETNIDGVPQVSREYHDARMSGSAMHVRAAEEQEPDFAALEL